MATVMAKRDEHCNSTTEFDHAYVLGILVHIDAGMARDD